jgi:hypothetical protein
LISAPDGGEWSTSRLDRFTTKEKAPGTHWIGGWVSPRFGLDTVENIKISLPLLACWELNPGYLNYIQS